MAMVVFERLNRRFGSWYEGLFGASESRDLRPRDVLRRILAAMEDARKEGLDGNIYVPNIYTVRIAVASEEERDYLRTFLSAEELASAVIQTIEQHGYRMRGGLVFTVEEVPADTAKGFHGGERMSISCRFDPTAGVAAPSSLAAPSPNTPTIAVGPGAPALPLSSYPVATPQQPVVPGHTGKQGGKPGGSPPADAGALPTIPAAPLALLLVFSPEGAPGEEYPLTAQGIRIGRGQQMGNELVLNDGMISKRHARIAFENGNFVLYDENSTNGTFVGDQPLRPGRGVALRSGDTIRVGMTRLRFIQSAPQPGEPPTTPAPVRDETPPPPQGGATDWKKAETQFDWAAFKPEEREQREQSGAGGENSAGAIAYRLVGDGGEVFPLASEMSVGRALTGDITLIGEGVASQHARLTIRNGSLYVEDLKTPAGTMVNGELIPPQFPVSLYDGDQIAFGQVRLRVERFTVGKGG